MFTKTYLMTKYGNFKLLKVATSFSVRIKYLNTLRAAALITIDSSTRLILILEKEN